MFTVYKAFTSYNQCSWTFTPCFAGALQRVEVGAAAVCSTPGSIAFVKDIVNPKNQAVNSGFGQDGLMPTVILLFHSFILSES